MVPECRHLMPTGRKCHAPAMGTSAYCYHHDRLHRYTARSRVVPKITIPAPQSPEDIVQAISTINNALFAGHITSRSAGRMLYGLQLAAKSLPKNPPVKPDSGSRRPSANDSNGSVRPAQLHRGNRGETSTSC